MNLDLEVSDILFHLSVSILSRPCMATHCTPKFGMKVQNMSGNHRLTENACPHLHRTHLSSLALNPVVSINVDNYVLILHLRSSTEQRFS
jgi:hypothetical protein